MDFVDSHLRQRRLAPCRSPPFQVTQINCASGTRRQAEVPRYLSRRCTFTGLPNRILKPFAERRFARQLRYLLDLDSAIRATHPKDFHHDSRAKFHAREIAHFTLADIVRRFQLPSAPGAHQLPVPTLPPDPKLERLGPLVDLMPVNPVSRPAQY